MFRPPSEAHSLIIQPTIGCSRNKCSFCEMYTMKKFSVRRQSEIIEDIYSMSDMAPYFNKVFLADGNAMTLSTRRLMEILTALNETFPKLRRVSSYALPSDISSKSKSELNELRDAGLKLLYVGVESGDDEVLKMMNKGETAQTTIHGCSKARESDMKLSVMIINGLGGVEMTGRHATNSAKVINEINPEYLSTLVLSFPMGITHFRKRIGFEFQPLDTRGLLLEMREFLSGLQIEKSIFRSDHVSNYLILKGILGRDKDKMISMIDSASGAAELRSGKYFLPEIL